MLEASLAQTVPAAVAQLLPPPSPDDIVDLHVL
jgi:hypothetical protein